VQSNAAQMNRMRDALPTISMFYGLVIRMFYNDHAPLHVHVQYGEFQAEMAIETLQVLAG
jgi:hypothetical protein